eukprot:TRINITY_DN11536_c0_g1_i1.p1 TRINITY_DN11536_c0_g1~~TRINITY_DN11536_c0_g1_i1.p1  ORF type:complete len:202 (+),score=23.26 TRINITY_DN11536_c0_g1_i1:56-661(+)
MSHSKHYSSLGTSLCAVVYKGGVVMGADSRTTMGTFISSRGSEKVIKVSDHCLCLRSGRSSHSEAAIDVIQYHEQNYWQETGESPSIATIAHVAKNLLAENPLQSSFILGGFCPVEKRGELFTASNGGFQMKRDYMFGGSGTPFIVSYLDANYKPDMDLKEAFACVQGALKEAIRRDGSSGGLIRMTASSEKGFLSFNSYV